MMIASSLVGGLFPQHETRNFFIRCDMSGMIFNNLIISGERLGAKYEAISIS